MNCEPPLNFVTNYAEIAKTTLAQLLADADRHNFADVPHVLRDLYGNVTAIYHHSQRAEQTIDSMMQLARCDSRPTWEMTALHPLLNQAIQLAYQGFRARYTHFQMAIASDYDPAIAAIPLVAPEFNRALIALVDNACYALFCKQRQNSNFQPQLQIQTRLEDAEIVLCLRDNGIGIARDCAGYLFDPFFTTKPPGEGTGLGLSLAHNIIVDRHGGILSFKSEFGQYTEFSIALPCQPHR
jgi:signal transduction histidine kinase